jgi:hypothetical protein
MKHIGLIGFFVLGLSGLTTACGDDRPPPADPSHGTGGKKVEPRETGGAGGKSTGGRSGAGGSAGQDTAGAGGADAGNGMGPVVTVTNPVAVDNPDDGHIVANGVDGVQANTVTAKCTAEPKEAVSSVTLEMLDADGKLVGAAQPGMPSTSAGMIEYFAKFTFTNVKNGTVSFRCTAKDKAGNSGSDTISTFVDQGPTIERAEPAAGSPHAVGELPINFTVKKAPLLASSDNGAEVASVSLSVNGTDVESEKVKTAGDRNGLYQLNLDLGDFIPPGLNGPVPISIAAKNERGVTRTDTYDFIVDGKGPEIKINKPTQEAIIGGDQLLEFTVTDPGSGVNKTSVVVNVNNIDYAFGDNPALWTENMGAYTFKLGAVTANRATVQLVVIISARDLAGNKSGDTSSLYYLDNAPPRVDLDPRELVESKKAGDNNACSKPFDPLGKKATSDWAPYLQPPDPLDFPDIREIRALVWDDGNGATGIHFVRYSGIDSTENPNPVKLYLQADADKGILLDSDNPPDGICDEVDTTLPPLDMYPVNPEGSASYVGSDAVGTCVAGTETVEPKPICSEFSDLTRVIAHEQPPGLGGLVPVIYALSPTKGGCFGGSDLQTTSKLKNGWACLAVRAVDRAKNVGVSAPMRMCVWDGKGTPPQCATMTASGGAPSCTRKCKAPEHFNPGVIDVP